MAFVNFSDAALHAEARPGSLVTPLVAAARPAEVLEVLERRVVALARNDRLESLRPQRKRGWFARLVLGPTPPSAMLANEQLEALRRLAVHAWHKGWTLPVSALKDARAAGYSDAKIGAVIDIIGRERAPFRRLSA